MNNQENKKELTVQQAIDILQSYVKHDPKMGEKELLITTEDKSIGSRAFVKIKGIFEGFDWEQGQIRIKTVTPVIKKYNDRDKEKHKILFIENIENKKYVICPICECRIGKKDSYCKHCGQHLSNIVYDKNYRL